MFRQKFLKSLHLAEGLNLTKDALFQRLKFRFAFEIVLDKGLVRRFCGEYLCKLVVLHLGLALLARQVLEGKLGCLLARWRKNFQALVSSKGGVPVVSRLILKLVD